MPKSLSKVQKHITKKKGKITHLHANSRDAQSLLRAGARDASVSKSEILRRRVNKPLVERVQFFQTALFPPPPEQITTNDAMDTQTENDANVQAKGNSGPLDVEATQALIVKFLARHDEERAELAATRRTGRPAGAREDALASNGKAERAEYDAGFWVPDLGDEKNLVALEEWNGRWIGLNIVKFVRVSRGGVVSASKWPPNAQS
ncbi:hypothetical protein BT63DRAFT_430323 [Microthyrium microscopicum]|uniref:Translation machinery-associated protein 16 n=1 Tax=Microthyrium microscopicum TaxID=703497 RepID=A0A6A6TXB9_9PEZI|nr:hypothetical protein BT63DRAFT_430323 [Microthyrium microscopicum]